MHAMKGTATCRVHMHLVTPAAQLCTRAEPCDWSDSLRTHVQGSKAVANDYRHTGVEFEPMLVVEDTSGASRLYSLSYSFIPM